MDTKLVIFYLILCLKYVTTYDICNVVHSSICGKEECVCKMMKGKKICQTCDVWCDRTDSIECNHGTCTPLGCQCDPCYTGDSCSEYNNLYAPEYVHLVFVAKVETFSRGVLRGVAATDHDASSCLEAGQTQCHCSRVIHRIVGVSSNHGDFKINHDTGDISYDVMGEDIIEVYLAGYNYDEFGYPDSRENRIGYAKVNIYVTDKLMPDLETHLFSMENVPNIYAWREEIFEEHSGKLKNEHLRYRRQAQSSIPDNVTAVLALTSGDSPSPDTYFYNYLPISLTISIPEGSSFIATKIYSELTAGNSPMFYFCDPDVTFVGSNFFGWSPTQFTTTLTSPNEPQVNDVLEIDIGVVTNDGSDFNTAEENDIVMEFNAYVMDPTDTVFDQPIRIFADILWDNATWMVVEKDFIIRDHANTPTDPLVTVVGPASLNPGATGTWTVKTFIHHPHTDLSVDIYGTSPSAVTPCSAFYLGHGDAYMCYNNSQVSSTSSASGGGGYLFTLGKIFNTDYNVSDHSEKYFSFLVYGEMPSSAAVGQNYSFTVDVDLSGTVFSFQQDVTSSDAAVPQAPGSPTLNLSPFSSTIHQGGQETIDVRVTLITNETDTYKVTVRNPTPANEQVHICDVTLGTVGTNVMCGVNKFNVTYISNENNNLNDEVIIDLGILTNVALDPDVMNNTVSVSVTVCYVSTGTLNLGDTVTIDGELQHGSVTDAPQSTSLTVAAGTPTATAPVVTLDYENGHAEILPRGHAVYDLTLTLPPNTYYENVNITFLSGYTVTPTTSICSVSVSVTGNLTCSRFSPAVYIPNSVQNTVQDSGYIMLGSLENTGGQDVIVTARVVVALVDISVVDGQTVITNASITYNSGSVWQGSITSTVNSVNTYPSSTVIYSLTSPQIIGVSNGGGAEFLLTAELPVGAITQLTIVATAGQSEIAICRVYVKSAGANIPCVSNDVTEIQTKYASGGGNSEISFTLPSVTNSGESPLPANNRITFGVIVLVRDGYDYGNLGNAYFNLDITHTDDWSTGTEAAQVYVNSSNAYTAAAPVLQLDAPFGLNVVKGSTIPVHAKVYTSPMSKTDYSINFAPTPLGKIHVCNVKLLSRGKHVCIDDTPMTTFVSSPDNSTYDSGSIQLGNILNWGPTGSTVQVGDNLLIVEVTLAIVNDVSVSVGNTLTCAVDLTHTVSQTVSDSASLSVVSTPTSVLTNIAVTNNPPNAGVVTAYISDYVTWGVNLHLPQTTDRYVMTIDMPYSAGEAHLTLVNASYVGAGNDIGCSQNTTVSFTLLSALSTSQMTQMTVDLGVISNTGSSLLNEFNTQNTNDNVVQFSFTFRVADHPANLHNSIQSFTISVAGDNGGSASTTGSVTIQVDATETALLEFDTWTDSLHHSLRSSGEELKLYGRLNLLNTSTAHASTVVVHYLLPTYTTFVAVNEWTVLQPTATVTAAGGVDLSYPLITFTDFPTFSLNVTLDPNSAFEFGSVNIQSVLPAEVTYISLQRPDRDDISTHNTLLDIVQFAFDSTVCDKIIGTDTTAIADSQISASSEANIASNVKRSSATGWRPNKRGKPFCENEFVEIDFINRIKIIALSVLSAGDDNTDYVTNFTVQYSNDGVFWTDLTDNTTNVKTFQVAFNGTKTINDAYRFPLHKSEEFTAAYVRIIPKSGNTRACDPALRVEFEGCTIGANNVNSTGTSTPTYTVPERSLLTDTIAGAMFVCIKSGVDGANMCSRSNDNGTSWEEIDGIGEVVGIVTNTSTLVGVSQDGMSQLCSHDDGVTWNSCLGVEVSEITSEANYVSSTPQPFDDFIGTPDDTMFSTYGFSHPQFDVTGVMNGIKVRTLASGSWNLAAWWGTSDWSLL